MSPEPQQEQAELALYFEGDIRLHQTIEILTEVNGFYEACAEAFAPEGTDWRSGGPVVRVDPGSMIMELVAKAEPGVWALTSIMCMNWLIKNGVAIATLPIKIKKRWLELRSDIQVSIESKAQRIVERQPMIRDDGDWREVYQPVERGPALPTLDLGNGHDFDPPPINPPGTPKGPEDGIGGFRPF